MPLAARRRTQNLYIGLASLILIGIEIEGVLSGPSLFAAPRWVREVLSIWEQGVS